VAIQKKKKKTKPKPLKAGVSQKADVKDHSGARLGLRISLNMGFRRHLELQGNGTSRGPK